MSDKCFNKYTKCKHNKMAHSPIQGLITGFTKRNTVPSFRRGGVLFRGCSAQVTRKPREVPPLSPVVNETCVTILESILVAQTPYDDRASGRLTG